MILIRTLEVYQELESFVNKLSIASGMPVNFIVDERKSICSQTNKIGITEQSIKDLGLFAPKNFGWACGDYGLYLARRKWPDVERFWLIENDVRIAGNISVFFEEMRARDEDVLCVHMRPSDKHWWWHKSARARDVTPYRCLFPIGRYSAKVIDMLLEKRLRHSGQITRRLLWPNDEAFVATTIANSDSCYADINRTSDEFYSSTTFSYDKVTLEKAISYSYADRPVLYHPVLNGPQLDKKLSRNIIEMRGPTALDLYRQRILGNINRVLFW